MLKKHAQFFKSLFFMLDLLVLSLAWFFSYFVRFTTTLIRPPVLGTPDFWLYVQFLPLLLIIWSLLSRRIRLYRPRRIDHLAREFFEVATCLTLTLVILIAVIYFFRRFEFSRLAFVYFWIIGTLGLFLVRIATRKTLKMLRRRGYNQRHALVAGTGGLARGLLEKVNHYPELGIHVIGLLASAPEDVGKTVEGIPVIGSYGDLGSILKENAIDILFIALPSDEYSQFKNLIEKAQGFIPDIKVVPASYEFLQLRGGMDDLDGLPIVSLQSSPLYGWNSVLKRLFDLVFGSIVLILVSPLMVVIAILIKLTSKGPVLYRQERIGMDGRSFQMLKFRTMKVEAEKETGPIWVRENDPRRTKIGALLRKTSLDELPQLLNVLKGEMSLVGPRPERPNFVEEFRSRIPSYMLRHKIKTGMTGWAQINGWRGNTSIEKRIEHDLYYIQNWSLGFDLKILFMTLWKGFFSKSAY